MNLFIHFFSVICLLEHGAFSADTVSVMEGDSVTLNTGVQTNQQEKIKWFFNGIRITEITGYQSKACTDVQCDEGNERFRDRLKLDHQTGSLTITNITNTDSGEYQLLITRETSNSGTFFNVTVRGVSAARREELKSVKEEESVTLDPGVAKNLNDSMRWYFNETLIAEITGDQSKICTDVQCEERFRDRLKLDHQTGSLTITNTRNTDSGEYKLEIIINSSSFNITTVKRFIVTVTDSSHSSAVSGSGLSSGAVAGIVVAAVVLLVLAVAAVIYYCRSRSHTEVRQTEDDDAADSGNCIPLTVQGEGEEEGEEEGKRRGKRGKRGEKGSRSGLERLSEEIQQHQQQQQRSALSERLEKLKERKRETVINVSDCQSDLQQKTEIRSVNNPYIISAVPAHV
ncbi:uncharacterized protein LOC125273088 [Megalobrama amblycephala]|uniref:uncharacterized protein LOC125273088 n=1 Tax=Megalobrama amblycephala TaxID=75352 RepID=UPI00201467D0|nr:uncharacterized protein LOC125273088 [Megalobrama amblycephala]